MKSRFAVAAAAAAVLGAAAARSAPPAHGPVGRSDVERKAAVLRCARCHAEAYRSWKAGPHAHSYEAAVGQWAKAHDSASALSPLGRRELKEMGGVQECLRCHSPNKNVYDSSIPSDWNGRGKLDFKELTVEEGSEVLTGGADCLTCHAEGARVVTRADYRPTPGLEPPPGFCDPKPSKAFSHVSGCVSCHEPVVKTYADRFEADESKRVAPFLDCNACHMERDAEGRRHHYYLWEGDAKKVAALIRPMFERFTAEIGSPAGRRVLTLRWPTGSVPHPVIPETPKLYIVTVDVLGAGGAPGFTRTLRFYSPLEDRKAADIAGRNPADELVALGARETFERTYPLPPAAEGARAVRLTVRKKPNSDYLDDTAKTVYVRETPVGL